MATKSLSFTISADDSGALKAFGRISKAAERDMKKATEALDDTRSAGKRMADGLSAAADEIGAELRQIESASGKLKSSLGADFDASDDQVRDMVQNLRRAGLTFEEIEADSDSLAASIKKLDDVKLNRVTSELKDVDKATKRVGDTTDKSRSVMANFAGNAASELPGVATAMGPVNVAIGQFAEYATEGDIAMSNLAKAIGPMVAATAGLAVANHLMGQWSKASEAAGEIIDGLTDKIREGERAIDALKGTWEDTGAVQIAVAKLFGSGAKDVTADLVKVGLSADSTAKIIEGGLPAARRWREEVVGMGVDGGDAYRAFLILAGQITYVDKAAKNAAVNAAFFRGELVYTQEELKATAGWAEGLATAYNSIPRSVHTSVTTSGGRAGSAPTATGGPRALGGSVLAGGSYVVGERGPEVFVPRVPGQIVPSGGGMGGGVVINVSVGGSVVSEGQLVDRIYDGLRRKNRRDGELTFVR